MSPRTEAMNNATGSRIKIRKAQQVERMRKARAGQRTRGKAAQKARDEIADYLARNPEVNWT